MNKVTRRGRAGSACWSGPPTGNHSHSDGLVRFEPRFGEIGDASRLNRFALHCDSAGNRPVCLPNRASSVGRLTAGSSGDGLGARVRLPTGW